MLSHQYLLVYSTSIDDLPLVSTGHQPILMPSADIRRCYIFKMKVLFFCKTILGYSQPIVSCHDIHYIVVPMYSIICCFIVPTRQLSTTYVQEYELWGI
jgi:hypothetical protein